jgi:ubiquilin
MGAPPNEEQMAEMLSNPMIAQTMNEALNNPNFVDYMIRSNPTLANMPNAREMLQSDYFRNMMTNPEAIRMAARMRRMMQGGGDAAFPAPGATDNTPAGAPGTGAAAGNNNDDPLRALFGAGGGGNPFGGDAANPLASLFGMMPPGGFGGAGGAGQAPAASNPAAASSGNRDAPAGSANTPGQAGAANPFSALFGNLGAGAGQGAAPGANANPFGLSPEAMRQMMQGMGMGGMGMPGAAAAAAPADNRPPEERYAEQLRQLNDMGFFDFDRNVTALRRSGGSVQGAIEYLLSNS